MKVVQLVRLRSYKPYEPMLPDTVEVYDICICIIVIFFLP